MGHRDTHEALRRELELVRPRCGREALLVRRDRLRRPSEPAIHRAQRHGDTGPQARIADLVALDDVADRLEGLGRSGELTRVAVRVPTDVEQAREIHRLFGHIDQREPLGHALERLFASALIESGGREQSQE